MKENRGFISVKVSRQKLRDVAHILNECRHAYDKGVENASILLTQVYQILTIKQKQELRHRRNYHIFNYLIGECDEVLDRMESWGSIDMNEILLENNKLFDETRHTPQAPATHLVCCRADDGSIGIVEQFASKTEALGFINDMGCGFIVEL